MSTVSTTYTQGMEDLRSHLLNGDGDINIAKSFIKALSGDLKISCSPSTYAHAATTAAWTISIDVSVKTNSDEQLYWYNGYVTLGISDTSSAGTGSLVSPITSGGATAMTDGAVTVVIGGDAAAWIAGETVTLVVSPTANNPGIVQGSLIQPAMCVVTFV